MAVRPWVTPEEVKAYSDRPEIKNRVAAKLAIDISRAEAYVLAYTNNDFSTYESIPDAVKTAVILLSENYGVAAAKGFGSMKSESFDDYSYTAAEGTLVETLGLGPLLDEFIVSESKSGVIMKLRKL